MLIFTFTAAIAHPVLFHGIFNVNVIVYIVNTLSIIFPVP